MTAAPTTPTIAGAEHPDAPAYIPSPSNPGVRGITALFSVTGMVLFTLFITTGVLMRMSQAGWITLSPSWFYRMLTMHGAGMLVSMMLAMMGAMYYAVSGTMVIGRASMIWAWATAVIGGVMAIVAIIIGNFAGAWTFLYPLPLVSAGGWTKWSAVLFLLALVFVALSWAIYMIEMLYRLSTTQGGIGRSSGLAHLFGRDDNPPPPSIIGATTVVVAGLVANVMGAIMVAALLVQSMDSSVSFDALWAKNLTYLYGHSVMNLFIYMAAAMIYMLIPRYTGREWKTNKVIVVAWIGVFLAVLGAYSHHLYLDFVQPNLANQVSQILSSVAALPLAVVTGYSAIILIWGSRYRWTMASAFLYLGFVGWITGGIGALIDSLIRMNSSFHNTLWVPAHFHGYLLMGVMFWGVSIIAHLLERAAGRPANRLLTWTGISLVMVGGYTLIGAWYAAGAIGVPRRWAVQPTGSHPSAVVGSIGALVLSVGVLFVIAALVHLFVVARRGPHTAAASSDESTRGLPVPVDTALDGLRPPGSAKVLGIVAIVTFAIAFSPPIADTFGAKGLREHHLVHTLQFAAGCLIGLWLAARSFDAIRRMSVPRAAIAVTVMQMLMMLAMVPAGYESVESSSIKHIGLHLVFTIIGIFAGVHAARLSRGPAWFITVLGVTAGLFWAAGSLT